MKEIEIEVAKKIGGLKCKVFIDEPTEDGIPCEIEKIGKGKIKFWKYKPPFKASITYIVLEDREARKNFEKITGIKPKRDSECGFKLTHEQQELIEKEVLAICRKKLVEKVEKEGVKVIFRQEVSDYDYPTIALNSWKIDKNEGNIAYFLLVMDPLSIKASELFDLLKEKGLFKKEKREFTGWSTVILTDYVAELTKEQADMILDELVERRNKEIRSEIEKIRNMPATEIVKRYFIRAVHVDEGGYFSDCPPYCDDCAWLDYFDYYTTPKEILSEAETFFVYSRNGKRYTYYRPSEDLIEKLSKHEVVEKKREELIKELSAKIYKREDFFNLTF